MAEKTTFIKLDRNIIDWRWFKTPKILSIFIWMIVKANIKEGHFQNETVKRGSLVTSNASIAEGCGLTIQNVRTALSDLERTGEITRNIKNHYQIITIVNYELYQTALPKQIYQNDEAYQFRPTRIDSTTNKQLTTNKEYKKERIKKENVKEKSSSSLTPLDGGGDASEEQVECHRGYPYPCGLYEKAEWMTEEEWENIRYMTVKDIPGIYRGEYDDVVEYLHDKKMGCLK